MRSPSDVSPTGSPELRHRPLLLAAIGLIVGLTAVAWPVNLLVVVLVVSMTRDVRSAAWTLIPLVVGLAMTPSPERVVASRSLVRLEANVAGAPNESRSGYSVAVDSGARLVMVGAGPCPVELGDRIHVVGVVAPPPDTQRENWLSRGIIGRLQAREITVVHPANPILAIANGWRRGFRAFVRRTTPEDATGWVAGMALSLREDISPNDQQSQRMSGTIHLTSASGLHVLVLSGFLLLALRWTPMGRTARLTVVLALLLGYFVAAGLHTPTLRAIVMAAVALFADRLRREYDALSALSLAAIVDLMWRPRDVDDLGFQLSFVTVAAFVLFSARFRGPRWSSAISSSIIACLATAPILIQRQGEFGLGTIPANALAVLALPFVELGSLIAYASSAVSEAFAQGLMYGVSAIANGVRAIVDGLGSDRLTVRFGAFSGYWVAAVYTLALMTWRPRVRRAR